MKAGIDRLNRPLAKLTDYWLQRSRRERVMLSSGACIAFITLLYSYAWRPAIQGYALLSKELPQLRSQVATMRSEAEQAQRLQSRLNTATLSGSALAEALRTSLHKAAFLDTRLSITDGTIQLTLTKANFAQWVEWLNQVSHENQLQLQSAQITALPVLGQVDIRAVLSSMNSADANSDETASGD